jgi:hypothetical protein
MTAQSYTIEELTALRSAVLAASPDVESKLIKSGEEGLTRRTLVRWAGRMLELRA